MKSGTWRLLLRAFEVRLLIVLLRRLPACLTGAIPGPGLFQLGPLEQILRHLGHGPARLASVPGTVLAAPWTSFRAAVCGWVGGSVVPVLGILIAAVARRVAFVPLANDFRRIVRLRGVGLGSSELRVLCLWVVRFGAG